MCLDTMKLSRKAGFNPQQSRQKEEDVVYLASYRSHKSLDSSTRTGDTRADSWEGLEISRQDLSFTRQSGQGAFSVVYEALLAQGNGSSITVAVKCTKEAEHEAASTTEKRLLTELGILRKIGQHANIVQLLGACFTEKPLCIVTKFLSGGTLLDYVRGLRAPNGPAFLHVSEHALLRLALGVCNGMEHLSLCDVIHGDLAARNVLLDEHGTPKLCDFGFSRTFQGSKALVDVTKEAKPRLPVKWLPLECLRHNRFTRNSDVWSFGIVLWEIFTLGGSPYPGVPPRDILRRLLIGYRMEKPLHCSDDLYDVMKACWEAEPSSRIDFPGIHRALERLLTRADRDQFIKLETVRCLYPYLELAQSNMPFLGHSHVSVNLSQ